MAAYVIYHQTHVAIQKHIGRNTRGLLAIPSSNTEAGYLRDSLTILKFWKEHGKGHESLSMNSLIWKP